MSALVHVYLWPGGLAMIEPGDGETHVQPVDPGLLDRFGQDRDAWFEAEPDDDGDWIIGERVSLVADPAFTSRRALVGWALALWFVVVAIYFLIRLVRSHVG